MARRWARPGWASLASTSRTAVLVATMLAAPRVMAQSRHDPHVFVRALGEASAVTRPVRYHLAARAPGAALATDVKQDDARLMLGGRADVAVLFVTDSGLALGPRLSYSHARAPQDREWTLVTGIDRYAVREPVWLHSVTAGIELQPLRRRLVVTSDIGFVYLPSRGEFRSADLQGRFAEPFGWLLLRSGFGGRWPLGERLAFTAMTTGELGLLTLPPYARATLSLGIDLKGGRR